MSKEFSSGITSEVGAAGTKSGAMFSTGFGKTASKGFGLVKAGRLKILAVASRQRAASYAQAPTFDEEGFPGVYADSMFGIYAPPSLPARRCASGAATPRPSTASR